MSQRSAVLHFLVCRDAQKQHGNLSIFEILVGGGKNREPQFFCESREPAKEMHCGLFCLLDVRSLCRLDSRSIR